MTNAERILRALDEKLTAPVELTIYGRAALALGFNSKPKGSEESLDVDAILPLNQQTEIEKDEQFWAAVDGVNTGLKDDGLYITHLFQEDQVILSEGWLDRRVKIELPGLKHLEIYRPSIVDLLLTKMMRAEDQEDLEDIKFLIHEGKLTEGRVQSAFASAKVPKVPEIEDAFEKRQKEVINAAKESEKQRRAGGYGDI